MKIAYLTSAYGRASDTFIRDEVGQLRKLGHDVRTFSIRRPDASHVIDEEVAAERGRTTYIMAAGWLRLVWVAILETLRHPVRFLAAMGIAHRLTGEGLRNRGRECAYILEGAYLARCVRAGGYKHIHDHIGENSAVVAAVAAHLAGVSYSMTLHGPSVFYGPEQFRIARKAHGASFVACISQFARSQCMAFTQIQEWCKLVIVHCGIGEQYVAAQVTAVRDVPRFLSVGRLAPEKGQAILIKAVSELRKRGCECELEIIGDGPSRQALEDCIRKLQLEDCVRLLGWKSPSAIAERLQHCRAFILPSFAEGLPVVLMESLALGRPVITTWVAGIPELVEEGVNGWLVPPGSVEALSDAMEKALQTPVETLTRMGLEGRAKVLRNHNAATESAKLAELFREAIERNHEGTKVAKTHEGKTKDERQKTKVVVVGGAE